MDSEQHLPSSLSLNESTLQSLGIRHEQVRPHEPDLALDVALLVPGIGVAEREGEPVVGGERGEGLGGPDLVADPAADAGGVVEDDPGGDAAHVFEDLLERLAHALGVLGGEDLGEPHVGEREGEHEEAHPAPCADDGEVGLPEVGLRLAGAPHQVEVGFGDASPLGLEVVDVMPDGGLAAGDAVLVAKALPDAARGVPLLAPAPLVLVEVPLDDRPVRVEHLLPGLLHRHLRRKVGGGQLRVHGVARDADFPRDLGDGLAAFAQLAYRIGLRHADHTFLTSLVDFSRRKPS